MIREDTRSLHIRKEIRACIDLGSSYFRLLVLEGAFPPWERFEEARLEIASAHEERLYVGWGEDLAITGTVSSASVARAREILVRLIAAARSLGCREPFLVGTNTLREARNASDVVGALEREAAMPISVLSPYDEARLGYIGSAAFSAADEILILFDVGGTSTEISWGRGIGMGGYRGFPFGTHRTRLICGPRSYSAAGLRRGLAALARAIGAREPVHSERTEVSHLPLFAEPSTILFTGGTAMSCVLCLRSMRGLRPLFEEMYPLTLDDIALLRRRLAAIAMAGRERRLPLDANRMRLLPAGLVLTEALFRHFRIRACNVTARDLRWGVAITGGAVRNGKGSR